MEPGRLRPVVVTWATKAMRPPSPPDTPDMNPLNKRKQRWKQAWHTLTRQKPALSKEEANLSTSQNLTLEGPRVQKRMPEENKLLLQFCTVCASNQNRSMEAHRVLKENGFNVESFGTGSSVRLPGPAIDKPVVYQFGMPYADMLQELRSRDQRLYSANGVLTMLDRNRKIKDHPERWQDHTQVFDVVFTCQERCFDAVCLDLLSRGTKLSRPCHVINIEIEDNHQEAAVGGKAILEMANMICESSDPDTDMISVLSDWQEKYPRMPCLYQLCFF